MHRALKLSIVWEDVKDAAEFWIFVIQNGNLLESWVVNGGCSGFRMEESGTWSTDDIIMIEEGMAEDERFGSVMCRAANDPYFPSRSYPDLVVFMLVCYVPTHGFVMPLGFSLVQTPPDKEYMKIDLLCVREPLDESMGPERGGKCMMEFLKQFAGRQEYRTITLESASTSIGFYRRIGFQDHGFGRMSLVLSPKKGGLHQRQRPSRRRRSRTGRKRRSK
jgi:ribosomal protein S18 acetylase RimI-like enzyme